eukprot:736164-Rhodomonas_salina.3
MARGKLDFFAGHRAQPSLLRVDIDFPDVHLRAMCPRQFLLVREGQDVVLAEVHYAQLGQVGKVGEGFRAQEVVAQAEDLEVRQLIDRAAVDDLVPRDVEHLQLMQPRDLAVQCFKLVVAHVEAEQTAQLTHAARNRSHVVVGQVQRVKLRQPADRVRQTFELVVREGHASELLELPDSFRQLLQLVVEDAEPVQPRQVRKDIWQRNQPRLGYRGQLVVVHGQALQPNEICTENGGNVLKAASGAAKGTQMFESLYACWNLGHPAWKGPPQMQSSRLVGPARCARGPMSSTFGGMLPERRLIFVFVKRRVRKLDSWPSGRMPSDIALEVT